MVLLLFLFGTLLSLIALAIAIYKTYEPKNPDCPGDVKDAKNNLMYLKIFRILGPALLLLGMIFALCGIGVAL